MWICSVKCGSCSNISTSFMVTRPFLRFCLALFLMHRALLLLFQIHETIESINQLKIQRDFMLSFSRDPKGYIQDWLKSQSRDLKVQYCYLYACMLISFRNLKSH